MHIRPAEPRDADRLLELMRELARFEDYIHEFAVTRESIQHHGFGENRLFTAFVAEQDEDLVGMAGNTAAEDFYLSLGASPDRKWKNWSLPLV